MSKSATFSFTGRDAGLSEALKVINKNVQNVSKATKDAAKSINRFNLALTALKAVANAVGKVISTAFSTIKRIISAGLNTLKSLISGTFKFIKSALSTLLSWTVKALGKVFDGVKKLFTNILNFTKTVVKQTTELVKKGVKTIIDSVQSYADKQYNEIQLKVSLGDSYDQVMKSFNKLLRYTTADKNDLLSVFATYAEVGKKPEEIEKYAKASVYMANATGQSLTRITRLLLGQEAAGTDLERVIHRLGISISEQEQSISNIDKIVKQLEPEMNALAKNSLNQTFANVKNDLIAIKEQIGQIFAGPIQYIAQSLDKLLTKLIGSNKIAGLADKLQKVFDEHIKPIVDKVFEFLEKFIMDPKGFLEALWKDIKQIGQNFLDNIGVLFQSLGKIIANSVKILWDLLKDIDFSTLLSQLTEALNGFVLGLGEGFGWWSDEEIDKAEGKLSNLLINAWNDAHPNFTLSKDDKWYENLWHLLQGLWDDLSNEFKPWWDEHWPDIKEDLFNTFRYLGDVVGVAINNAIASSSAIRKILNVIPGVNFGSTEELREKQTTLYAKVKDYLPSNWTASDLTYENLMSSYSKNQTWLYHLLNEVEDAREELTWIRKTDILETKAWPNFNDYLHPVNDISDKMGPLVDALKDFREVVDKQVFHYTGSGFTVSAVGGGTGIGGGGIQDLYSNEFRIKPYSEGGPINKPTIALLGENGPEYVLSNKMLRGITKPNLPSLPTITTSTASMDPWTIIFDEINKDFTILTKDVDNVATWFKDAETLPDVVNEIEGDLDKDGRSNLRKFWDAVKDTWKNKITNSEWWSSVIEDGYYSMRSFFKDLEKVINLIGHFTWDDWEIVISKAIKGIGIALGGAMGVSFKGVGFLAQNGAFGSHIGNIWTQIMEQEDLDIWKAIMIVLKEFLPYLQKGLEVVGSLFDQAFDILGNVVQILGERLGKTLLPILEAFVPLMKMIGDILISLAPVVESVLQPAIMVIAAILRALVPILDMLMPAFAGIGAVIQWVSDAISWVIGSLLNWLGSIHIGSWYPFAGVGGVAVKKPTSISENYNNIMDTYSAARAASVTGPGSSTSTASQTASYNGAAVIHIHNDFSGSYVIGNSGFRELSLIIKNTLEDIEYSGQSV